MINLSEALDYIPHALVSALPPSRAVDLVLSDNPFIESLNSEMPHQGSPACLDVWEQDFECLADALKTCANPDTLLAAFDRYRDSPGHREDFIQVLANPSTPRVQRVVEATRATSDWGKNDVIELQSAFAQQYTSYRRLMYDRVKHADLIQAVLGSYDGMSLLVNIRAALSSMIIQENRRLPDDHLFDEPLSSMVNEAIYATLNQQNPLIVGRSSDGELTLDNDKDFPQELADLLGRHPHTLTTTEKAKLRELLLAVPASADRYVQDICRLGVHVLDYKDVASVTWLDVEELGDADLDNGVLWAETWVADGLPEVKGLKEIMPVDVPAEVMREVGKVAWETFGDDESLWTLFITLMRDGWAGTFQEMLETVQAAS